MEITIMKSVSEVLNKFHLSFDAYENYIEEKYNLGLKSKNIFLDIFMDFDHHEGVSKEEKLLTGSFYTPHDVANLIVLKTLENYEGDLKKVKVADISSGTGNLLIAYINQCEVQDDKERTALLKRIYAYELQWEALLIYINRILLMYEIFPFDLCLNITLGNTLEMNINERFDIVLGNPPYIGEKNNKDFFREIKKNDFGNKYYESKMDFYYYFLYKGWQVLKPDGIMGVISTSYYFTADGAVNLRKYIKNNIDILEIINFNDQKLFKEAVGQHSVITITSLKNEKNNLVKIYNQNKTFEITRKQIFSDSGYLQVYTSEKDYELIEKIKSEGTYNLGDFFEIHQGIVSGADFLNQKKKEKYKIQNEYERQGIFVLTEKEINEFKLKDSPYLKKFYKNSDIGHFQIKENIIKYILYIDEYTELDESSVEYQYLKQFKEILLSRREIQNGLRKWYALQWPRNKNIFETSKIVVPHRSNCNKFALSKNDFYASADVYYIVPRTEIFKLEIIVSILNSKLMYFWLYNNGKKKGSMLELYSTPLKRIPISYSDLDVLDELMKVKTDMNNFDKINDLIYKLYSLSLDEIKFIDNFYSCMGTEQ
ncbi:MAG: Eco57I restriction-modification methylase domain-containing protein [Clostridiales bacterium]|nr:Eco57I restriction-modification methylase domain-containing protein [Clostridiales bacterium]